MDTGIADLLQRFQQNDIVELSEASEEKSRQTETIEFGTSARYQITTQWQLMTATAHQEGYIIGHGDRSIIGGKATRPKTEQVNLLKIQNPMRRPVTIWRG